MRKKKKKYTYSKPDETVENILQRDFYASAPNLKRAADVTEFKVPGEQKKLYLSAVLDLYDRYPAAYTVSAGNDNRLVFGTFDRAIAAFPDARPVFHSDRGFQYTSRMFQKKLEKQDMEQSMSRAGHCIDNGPAEGFRGIRNGQDRYHCKTTLEVRQEALDSDMPIEYPIPENKRINKYKEKWCA